MKSKDLLKGMLQDCLQVKRDDGNTWAGAIAWTLLHIAVTPEEYGEDATVNAARLVWEIIKDGNEIQRPDC